MTYKGEMKCKALNYNSTKRGPRKTVMKTGIYKLYDITSLRIMLDFLYGG